jgi:ABC-type nitrate/sulfonate/bicarbonate transport system substrate-binding protein
MRDAMGGAIVTEPWVVKEDFLKKHRKVLVDLIEDQIRARRWMSQHPEEVAKMLEKVTKIPAKSFAEWVMTKRGTYHAPDLMFDVATLQKNIDMLAELKLLPGTIEAKKYVDLSLAKEANKRAATN